MNELDRIFGQTSSIEAYASEYFAYLGRVLSRIDPHEISEFVKTILDTRAEGGRIFFMGNGGSAATASHFANDIAIGTCCWDKPFRAISLTDNISILTAIGNDDGYENIFVQQLQTQMEPGDLVVAISASGNSPNVVKAIDYANQVGVTTVGLTAFDGGRLRRIARIKIHIPTNKGEYGPAEDAHMIIQHLVGTYLARVVCNENS